MKRLLRSVLTLILVFGIMLTGALTIAGCEDNKKYTVKFMTAQIIVEEGTNLNVTYELEDTIKVRDEATLVNKAPSAEYQNGTTYVFAGWYTEKECIYRWDIVHDEVETDLVLYAKYVKA